MFCHGGPASLVDDPPPPLGEGRIVALPPPETEIVQVATTPVPEPELTVEIGDRPTIGHLEETVLYSVDDYYTLQPVTPRLSASSHQQIPLTFTLGPLLLHQNYSTAQR